MEKNTSNYERLLPAFLLAGAAGGLDAYSYLMHGQVFAGLQTGNVILLSINLGQQAWSNIGRYIFSITMFILGTFVLRFLQHYYPTDSKKHISRQSLVIIYEIILLTLVMIISGKVPNLAILATLSIAAAAQLQEFRKIKGLPFTSLMMTGNLRTVAEGLYDSIFHHDRAAFKKTMIFGGVILGFASGAVLVGLFVHQLKNATIIISIIFLLLALIFSHEYEKK